MAPRVGAGRPGARTDTVVSFQPLKRDGGIISITPLLNNCRRRFRRGHPPPSSFLLPPVDISSSLLIDLSLALFGAQDIRFSSPSDIFLLGQKKQPTLIYNIAAGLRTEEEKPLRNPSVVPCERASLKTQALSTVLSLLQVPEPTYLKSREHPKRNLNIPHKEEEHRIMKLITLTVALCCAAMASASVVITPILPDQEVVNKNKGDCFFGVTTPMGCGPAAKVAGAGPNNGGN